MVLKKSFKDYFKSNKEQIIKPEEIKNIPASFPKLYFDNLRIKNINVFGEKFTTLHFYDKDLNGKVFICPFKKTKHFGFANFINGKDESTLKKGAVYLTRIELNKKMQDKGIGKVFLKDLIYFFKYEGIKEIYLDCNSSLKEFYEKLGFVEIGRKFSSNSKLTEIKMRIDLKKLK